MDKAVKNGRGETLEEFLNNYDADKYEKPSVTVDTLLFSVTDGLNENIRKLPDKELKILLVKRKDHPYIGEWAVPGGFVNIDENVGDAVLRELREETSIDNIYLEQLYTWGDVGRDPRMRVISISYMALVNAENLSPKAGDDAEDVKWFKIKERSILNESRNSEDGKIVITRDIKIVLESEDGIDCVKAMLSQKEVINNSVVTKDTRIKESDNIAFDHIKIINYAIERLQNKLEYTAVAFNLLQNEFTLTELQKVYETILGRKLITPNFRRKIAAMVKETGTYKSEFQHRPAKLYKYCSDWHTGF